MCKECKPNQKTLQEQIDLANKLIDTWPDWKKNILRDSGKSTLTIPRKPIVNEDYY